MLPLHPPVEEAAITLGSWPDWIAAIGTSLAFIIAAVTYFRSTRSATEAQARLVYASFDEIKSHPAGETMPLLIGGASIGGGEGYVIVPGAPGTQAMQVSVAPIVRAVIRVHNGSNELMGPAKIQLWNNGLKKPFERVTMNTGPIEPEKDYIVDMSVINEHFPGEPSVGLVLIFRDSSNRWWKRHGFDPIERIHDDPHNMAETPAQRAARAETIKRLGLGEIEPLPKIPLSVRWHRFWRRMRGKSPVP